MAKLPLTIRNVAPGTGFTCLTGLRPDGLPDGVHTGGAWLSPSGEEVWKPLDGRPYANADFHASTREADCLTMMAGQPGFPRNWEIREAGTVTANGQTFTRRWLVREKAHVAKPNGLKLRGLLQIEQGVRELNCRGWELGDILSAAVDRSGRLFVLDLSAAWPSYEGTIFDDESKILVWFEEMEAAKLAELRRMGRHVCSPGRLWKEEDPHWPKRDDGSADTSYCHVYASRNRGVSSLWAEIPGAHFVDGDWNATGVWTWVVAREPLSELTLYRYELTWAWSPIRQQTGVGTCNKTEFS